MPTDESIDFGSINEYRHFNFDSNTLSNELFNTFATKWTSIVTNELLEKVKKLVGRAFLEEATRPLKSAWFDSISQPTICIKFELVKEVFDEKILNLPNNFVLASDIKNAKLRKRNDEEQMLEKIKQKRAKILELRIINETLKEYEKQQIVQQSRQ